MRIPQQLNLNFGGFAGGSPATGTRSSRIVASLLEDDLDDLDHHLLDTPEPSANSNPNAPVHWNIVFDDGADGCMPAGYYAIGLNYLGLQIRGWLQPRHEYGPFATADEAAQHGARVTDVYREKGLL